MELAFARQMDFSPLRPDDWAKTDAERWNFYIQYRIAFEDGRDDVREKKKEAKEAKRRREEIDRKTKEMHAKHTGSGATF